VYTLTYHLDAVPERFIPEEILSWNRKNLRNFVYPPEYEIFMNMLLEHQASNEDLLAALPVSQSIEATLHSDAGPAFISLTKLHFVSHKHDVNTKPCCRDVRLKRTACAKHNEANITSCPSELKEPAMELLYARNISIHMAYEIRDSLLSSVSANANISSTTKEWFIKTFGSDEGMMVSVHFLCRVANSGSAG